ncbi:MAG TPA: polysaccharide deacetylase family protein [Thermoanaerobaculia bacterium]|nr:polysaccharide deacetylase family protein [Thermoanaerobaculia bacterium]
MLALFWRHAYVAGVGVLALSHALVLYPTLRPNVQWLGAVMTRFRTDRKDVWLTIDDGPTDDTRAVLDLFDRYNVKATFFVKGVLAASHPELVREIVQRGHTIGNHSNTHPAGTFWCAPPARIAREVDLCNDAVAAVAGEPPRWFRAPVGLKNPFVHPHLERRAMRLIGWTARGYDAVLTDPDAIAKRVLRDVKPGAILLMHQGLRHSLPSLERVIATLRAEGYAFVVPNDAQLIA